MKYPEYAEVDGKKYKINTDYRTAIECQEIAYDESVGEYERALAIIYKLFGEEGLKDFHNQQKLMEMALKFLSCGKEIQENKEEPDMDFIQDMDYIEASFMSDYKIDLTCTNMHWWKFFNLINGLSNSEFGDCCVLNRVRNLRNYDTKDIKDPKELEKIKKAKKQVELKKRTRPNRELSTEQKNNIDKFYEQMGIERRE